MTSLVFMACAVIGMADVVRPPGAQQRAARLSDPAVDAYIEFVKGKQLEAPADRMFILAALDRLASAVEGLALRKIGPDAQVLSAARKTRHELRLLEPFAADTPGRFKNRRRVFVGAGKLVEELSRELGPRGADEGLRQAVVRAADSIDYDDPARWQPDAVEIFFDLAARALSQMADGGALSLQAGSVPQGLPDGPYVHVLARFHEEAIKLDALAEAKATSEIRRLAARLRVQRQKELAELKHFMSTVAEDMAPENWGSVKKTSAEPLQTVSGRAFDEMYLDTIIAHHEDALRLTRTAQLVRSNVREFAARLTQSLTMELKDLRRLR